MEVIGVHRSRTKVKRRKAFSEGGEQERNSNALFPLALRESMGDENRCKVCGSYPRISAGFRESGRPCNARRKANGPSEQRESRSTERPSKDGFAQGIQAPWARQGGSGQQTSDTTSAVLRDRGRDCGHRSPPTHAWAGASGRRRNGSLAKVFCVVRGTEVGGQIQVCRAGDDGVGHEVSRDGLPGSSVKQGGRWSRRTEH